MFGNKIKNNFQFFIMLNNEAIVLNSFIQAFGMVGMYFSQFFFIEKINKLVPNQPR